MNSADVKRRPTDLLHALLSRHEKLYLALVLLPVILGSYVGSERKPLWYDEIFSVIVATQPTLHKMAQAMPADANPPLYAVLAKVLIHFFHASDFIVRLPSLLGFLVALVGVFVFVRRECGVLFGLLATALVYSEPGWTYAFEARPYTLLLAFLMVALVSWQSATRVKDSQRNHSRGVALSGMALGIVCSILSHNLGVVVVGTPLLFGEAVRTWRRRQVDWPLLAIGLSSAVAALAITIPMIRRTNSLLLRYQHNYLHPLTWEKFTKYGVDFPMQSLSSILSWDLILWLAAVVLLAGVSGSLSRRLAKNHAEQSSAPEARVPPHIAAAVLGAALLLPVTWLTMMSTSGYYISRYGIGSMLGIAMLICLLLRRSNFAQTAIPLALLVGLVGYFSYSVLDRVNSPVPHLIVDHQVYDYPSSLPVVVNDPYRYLEMWYYAPPAAKDRLVYLKDEAEAIEHGYVIVEAAMASEGPLIGASMEPFDAFLSSHSEFLYDLTGDTNMDVKQRLEAAGFRVTFIKADKLNGSLYEAEKR